MLNITAQKSPEGAKAYFSTSDYLSDRQELDGNWGGKGAALLGLAGKVEKDAFDALCDNLDPRTHSPLTQLTREGRRTGYDFTWSAPKSVSVVHASAGDGRIMEAFRESITDTMGEIEQEMQTRVRRGNRDEDRLSGNMIWSEFVHLTSRPVQNLPCPQLHSHVFCFNATFDPIEDRWKAGQFGRLKADGYYWQAVQQARFAHRLAELGYGIRGTKHAFEIEGIPQSALTKFSLRTAQIERAAERLGVTDPKVKAKLAATTREAKNDTIPYSELIGIWRKQLATEEGKALRDVAAAAKPREVTGDERAHVRFAADHEFYHKSVVDERRLLTTALRHGCGRVMPEGVRKEVGRLGLLRRQEDGRTLVTTKGILAEERKLIGMAVRGKGAVRPLMGTEAIEFHDRELDAEQRAAVELPLRSSDRVTIIRGMAGTGKSRAVAEAVRQIDERGRGVVLVAPTGRAVEVLREDGFKDADTLARLLVDKQMQERARNGHIVLDEAGMVGCKSMNAVFRLGGEYRRRVTLLGDRRQLPAVERGTALRDLEDRAGLKVAEILEIRRQTGAYRDAVKLLARGMSGDGLEQLEAMGCVKLMPVWDSYRPLARDYAEKVAQVPNEKRSAEALIVCPTHAEGERIVHAVRDELRNQRLIDDDERPFRRLVPLQWTDAEKVDVGQYEGHEFLQFHRACGRFKAGQQVKASEARAALPEIKPANFAVYAESTIALAKRDLVRVTAKGKTKDGKHTLSTGSVYGIDGFTRGGDVVLTNGWVVDKSFGHFAHGYVNTAFAAQGRTVRHVLIAQSAMSYPASSREGFYVAVSRGRMTATIYTDDRRELRAAVERSDPRRSATELAQLPEPSAWQRMRQMMTRRRVAALVAMKIKAQEVVRSVTRVREYAHER